MATLFYKVAMFGLKTMVCAENNFSPMDLMNFVASLIRSSKISERRFNRSNYSWLSSRSISSNGDYDLDEYKSLVLKLTPENCATIAVKLQVFAEEMRSPSSIVTAFKNLLEEQYSIQIMEVNVKRGSRRKRPNKVRPILSPPGREATVSFILN